MQAVVIVLWLAQNAQTSGTGTRKAAGRGHGRVALKPLSILSKIETFSFPWFDLFSLVSFQFSTEQVLTL